MAKGFFKRQTNENGNYNKFQNKKVEVDGFKFDSQAEADRYGVLKLKKRIGDIEDFKRQVTFPMIVNGELVCKYIADFVVYHKHGGVEVEDVKSEFSRKDPVYRLKLKLMHACHGITIKEILK